jgi:hypothetical protein
MARKQTLISTGRSEGETHLLLIPLPCLPELNPNRTVPGGGPDSISQMDPRRWRNVPAKEREPGYWSRTVHA